MSRKKQKQAAKKTTTAVATSQEPQDPAVSGWSQKEQNQLETAMKSIPKGTPERWQRIAECVPSKTLVSPCLPSLLKSF